VIRVAESDADLDLWARIRTAASPRDELKRPLRSPDRLLLLAGEIGCARAAPSDLEGHVSIGVYVLPEARRRGLGGELYGRCLEHARSLGRPRLFATIDALSEPGLRFAAARGFAEVGREVELRRTIGDEAEPQPLPGVEVVSLAERPELLEAAYDAIAVEAYADMPVPGNYMLTREKWLEEEGAVLPEATFVALDGDEVVGWAGLHANAEHGLTAVRSSHRCRGIATHLKRRQLAWAAAAGIPELVTFTQGRNDAMQRVNERLGYVAQPAWLKLSAPLDG
jgi:GNAT superfamily N-acetyltransferase